MTSSRSRFLVPLLGALVFCPMLGHTFYRDDFQWVSHALASVGDPARWLAYSHHDFRPLASLSFVFNAAVSGIDPRGYFAFNFVLHLAAVAVFMALVWRLSRGSYAATAVAGGLAAMALGNYGEAIYWICGRTGPLADVFVLACVLFHWNFLERGRRRDRALALAAFVLALLGKETSAILLPLLALLEWAHGDRVAPRRLLPFAVVLALYLVFQFGVWRANDPVVGGDYRFGPHVVTRFLEYMLRLFVPVTPDSFIVRIPAWAESFARVLFPWGGLLVVAAGIVLLTRPLPRPMKFALLWVAIAILPVTPLTLRTATRYLYLPGFGLCAFLGMAWAAGWRLPARRPVLAAALAALLVVQAAVMQVVLARRAALERVESVAPMAELRRQWEAREPTLPQARPRAQDELSTPEVKR